MFSAIVRFFSRRDPVEDAAMSPALAEAVILVAAARADGFYSPEERELIEAVLCVRHGLDAEAGADLRLQAERTEAESAGVFEFTNRLKRATPRNERSKIVEAMWSVALSDAERDPGESALIARVAELLGLDARDNTHARRRIADRMEL